MASGSNSHENAHDALEVYFNLLRARRAKLEQWAETIIPLSAEELEEREAVRKGLRRPREEEDWSNLFRPERAGLGAEHLVANKSESGGLNRSISAGGELEKLRKQLLGKKAGAKSVGRTKEVKKSDTASGKSGDAQKKVASDDESDSDGGRTSAFTSKRQGSEMTSRKSSDKAGKTEKHSPEMQTNEESKLLKNVQVEIDSVTGDDVASPGGEDSSERSAKRSRSFLDEVLTAKAKKKRSRNK